MRGNKYIIKLLGGYSPTSLQSNENEPRYTVSFRWQRTMEFSTSCLQPTGMKRSYNHTMNKYSEDDAILDIDAILGIENDGPVISQVS